MLEVKQQIGETITQAITFLIFYWIMARFAWPVIKNLLEERRLQIEAGFAEIDRKKADAAVLFRDYEERLRQIDQEARHRMQEAIAEGRRVAGEIQEHAQAEAVKTAERAQRNLEIELGKARVELRKDLVEMTLAASERLLRQKLDDASHREQVSHFIQDLERRN